MASAGHVGAAETIAALATPPGRGGVGVIRVSGPGALGALEKVARRGKQGIGAVTPREATYVTFVDGDGETIDSGLVLYFEGPASFTGEDVVECHCHGSPHALAALLARLLALGVRQANPGEFSQRAFLNGKLDLAQAEAVADLIAASSAGAARAAARSLQGVLSDDVNELAVQMLRLRAWLEATIDFDDEDDVTRDHRAPLGTGLHDLAKDLGDLRARCATGRLLRDGLTVVIAGPPNAGKSSLINALAEDTVAIVTDLPGTTRDVLRAELDLDGVPVRLLDTAGLRQTNDAVEQVGVARAIDALRRADAVLFVVDTTGGPQGVLESLRTHGGHLPEGVPIALVRNKIDLSEELPHLGDTDTPLGSLPTLGVSARTGLGLELLREHLQRVAGLGPHQAQAADAVSARARHIEALDRAAVALERVDHCWREGLPELVAEELRAAHEALMEITGEVTTETLLGEIFSRFCIGK